MFNCLTSKHRYGVVCSDVHGKRAVGHEWRTETQCEAIKNVIKFGKVIIR